MPSQALSLLRRGAALCLLCGYAAAASASQEGGSPARQADLPAGPAAARSDPAAAELLAFDIPAQPLALALHQYASVSGRPALFSSELVADRRSAAIRGMYSPQAALRGLLQGTGLLARRVADGSADVFVLVSASAQRAAGRAGRQALDLDYGGLVQARIWAALCADARTAPGEYRSLLRFWVDQSGHVRRARLLASTGLNERDQALAEVLNDVRIERSPPPDMKQPLTMIVLPLAQDGGRRCETEVY